MDRYKFRLPAFRRCRHDHWHDVQHYCRCGTKHNRGPSSRGAKQMEGAGLCKGMTKDESIRVAQQMVLAFYLEEVVSKWKECYSGSGAVDYYRSKKSSQPPVFPLTITSFLLALELFRPLPLSGGRKMSVNQPLLLFFGEGKNAEEIPMLFSDRTRDPSVASTIVFLLFSSLLRLFCIEYIYCQKEHVRRQILDE